MIRIALIATLLAGLTGEAQAEAYENAVSIGAYIYGFNSSSKDLAGPYTPPGVRVSVANADTVALIYTRMLTPDWSVTLALGTPPTYHLVGKDAAAPLGLLANLRAASPALIVQHHWQFEDGKLEPFVGLGIDYNHFYHLRASQSLEGALGGLTTISVNDVWSPVITAGANLNITEQTFITLAASYVGLAAAPQLTTGSVSRSISVQLNPVVYRLTVGYRF